MKRSVAVMKMHLTDRITLVALPLGILAAAFAVNVVIWLPLPEDGRRTGGAASVLVFVLAAAMFAVVRGLPFALGMGATRRAFAVGTVLTGAVLALGFGTLYLLLSGLEELTDGWGLHGTFFDFAWFGRSAVPARWAVLVLAFLASWLLGAAVSALWPRWGVVALVIGGPATILVGGGGFALVTWRGWWDAVGGWFAGLTPLTSSGWLLLLSAALAAATWGSLRRVSAT
jgi:hypothetical protein